MHRTQSTRNVCIFQADSTHVTFLFSFNTLFQPRSSPYLYGDSMNIYSSILYVIIIITSAVNTWCYNKKNYIWSQSWAKTKVLEMQSTITCK